MTLSATEVLALAPDAASAKAARGLTAVSQWPTLGASDAAVWGECQGSGAKPYQTQVDLSGPAFRCSCPSRKFPCKHGLALLLIRAESPAAFGSAAAPAWVTEWLGSRAEKAQKKEDKAADKAAPAADPAAAARREAQRWERIEAAAAELLRWLDDQIDRGLGNLSAETLKTWHTMAARMVDAQAPGLAQRVTDAALGVQAGEDWPELTLHRLGLLHLACVALTRRASLDEALQAELRTVAGWPSTREDVVAAGERIDDHWYVLASVIEERSNKLSERRVWLHGRQSGRRALLLEHAFDGRGFAQIWRVGAGVDTTLCFFPGSAALRALTLATDSPVSAPPAALPVAAPLDDEWDTIATRVARAPWTPAHPLVVRGATLARDGATWIAVAAGRALPLALDEANRWALLAATGGSAHHLVGEWNGFHFAPLAAWSGDDGRRLWQRGAS